MDRAVLLLCALLLNVAFCGPKRVYARLPFLRFLEISASLVRAAERKLNRDNRSVSEREIRGAALVVFVIVCSVLLGWIGEKLFSNNLGFIKIVLLATLLPVRQTWDIAAEIHRGLKAGNVGQARMALSGTACRQFMILDDSGVARAAIEMLAVNFSEKILAPAFWFLLFGLPGLFVSKTNYLMVENLTHATVLQENPSLLRKICSYGFNSPVLVMNFMLHYVPSRIAAFLWPAAAMFLPSGNGIAVAKTIVAGEIDIGSPRYVSVLAAASSLSLSLGGPSSSYTDKAWIGAGAPKATPANVRKAMFLFALLHLFVFILLGIFL